MVKSYGWWWVVAHVIIVSPPVPIGLGFGFWTTSGLDLGLRGPDLGLGLDNFHLSRSKSNQRALRALKSESYSRSLKYCVLLKYILFCTEIS